MYTQPAAAAARWQVDDMSRGCDSDVPSTFPWQDLAKSKSVLERFLIKLDFFLHYKGFLVGIEVLTFLHMLVNIFEMLGPRGLKFFVVARLN